MWEAEKEIVTEHGIGYSKNKDNKLETKGTGNS